MTISLDEHHASTLSDEELAAINGDDLSDEDRDLLQSGPATAMTATMMTKTTTSHQMRSATTTTKTATLILKRLLLPTPIRPPRSRRHRSASRLRAIRQRCFLPTSRSRSRRRTRRKAICCRGFRKVILR